jgi:nitrite reductase/ring-hydroxylating ferredoxin subunit
MSDFVRIGSVSEIDGVGGVVRTILGRAVRIWIDDEGSWQAMEFVCRHQNGDLSNGRREGDLVVCPRHGWRYDVKTGACLTEAWAGLRRHQVKIEHGQLFVSLRQRVSSPD